MLNDGGYRFDMGPTILTMPSVLRRVFSEAGRDMADYLDLLPCDPQWRCFFDATPDGKQPAAALDLVADVRKMKANITAFGAAPGTAEGYGKFLDYAKRLDGVSDNFFFWKSVGGITDTFSAGGMFDAKILSDLLALRMGSTVAGTVRKFLPDERVAQLVDHFTQYVGSAPDQSPAVLCGIAHMQTSEGIWYPRGGTRAVPVALEKLATELGVEFRTGTWVTNIETKKNRVTGVVTSRGDTISCTAVVSNSDCVRTFKELVGGDAADEFLGHRHYEPACSGVVLYLGLKKAYDHLLHHNFVFSDDAHEEFETIYRKGEPAPDPTCYVCAPGRSEPGVAPPGGEAIYVLVHTPYLRKHHDWTKMLPGYRRVILNKLKRTAGLVDLEDRIEVEHAPHAAGH